MAQAQIAEINLNEILKQVAREKDIDLERWISALEDAMASAAKKQHRIKEPVKARLDRETGRFEAFIVKQVVEEIEDPLSEWSVEEARDHKPDAEVGDEIHIPISTEGLGRIAAQSAKQVLYQRVREAERENIYNEFIGRVGEVLNGTVKRFERGDVIVDLGRTEAIVPRSEQARHERYSQGERIRAVIVDVHTQPKGPQIVLSRTDPRLLAKLFEMEVPEIYDGTVVIKNAVRAPGERAKVAVYSRERDVDPVGACVGMKGSRVQSIIRELRGEKIDIIEHSDDLVTFAQSALAPAKITRVSITHSGEHPHLDVIVEDEQLSLAIGKRGQNVRLAAELIGAKIDIKSESDVKDEVADALAKMLQTAMSQSGEERRSPPLPPSTSPRRRASARRPPRSSPRRASAPSRPCAPPTPRRSRRSRGSARRPPRGSRQWAEEQAAAVAAADPFGGRAPVEAPRTVHHGRSGLHGGAVQGVPGERDAPRLGGPARRRRRGGRDGERGGDAERTERAGREALPRGASSSLWARSACRTWRR